MKVYKITCFESSMILKEDQFDAAIGELKELEVGETARIEVLEMTKEKYESLEEFNGF